MATPISILMPIYNGIEYIHDSVKTILNQTNKSWELIIGINGHLPNSKVYHEAKKYEYIPKIRVIELPEYIKGKSAALNAMLEFCRYEWVALFDVDDIWHYSKLEIQIPHLSNYDVVGTHCQYFGQLSGHPKIPIGDISNYDFLLSNPIINSSIILRKELAQWNEKTTTGIEDYELLLELKYKNDKKIRFYNCPEVLVGHRIHSGSAYNSKGNNLHVQKLKKLYS
jgi:glycosyltransferase involved in cell wall biosynthesis